MAENNPPAKSNWSGIIWASPINVDKLTAEFNKVLDGVEATADAQIAVYQAKADRFRRQRNGLAVIIIGIAVNSYLNARNRKEAERVNPPRGM